MRPRAAASLSVRFNVMVLPSASLRFPFILRPRLSDRLPLHVRGRIKTATGERHNMIFDPARAGAARQPGRGARMHQLELVFHRGRSRLLGGSGD